MYSQMPIAITNNGGKLRKNCVSTLNVIWYGWLSRAPAIRHLANQFSPASLKVRLAAQWAKWLLAFLLHVFVRPQSRLNQSMLHNASENVPDTSVWEVLVVPWIDKRGFYGETNIININIFNLSTNCSIKPLIPRNPSALVSIHSYSFCKIYCTEK